MLDFFKKTMYVGLGLATMTKEKAEAAARDLAKYAKLTEEEGHKLADYLQSESKKARTGLKETVETAVQSTMRRMPYKRKIELLEQRVAALEAAVGIEPPSEVPEEPEEPETTDAPEETGADEGPAKADE